jgi:hypothetical protein
MLKSVDSLHLGKVRLNLCNQTVQSVDQNHIGFNNLLLVCPKR